MKRFTMGLVLSPFLAACAPAELDVGGSVDPSQVCGARGSVESVVVEADQEITHFAIDTTHAYYFAQPPMTSLSSGPWERILKRVPLAGGAPTELARMPMQQLEPEASEQRFDIALVGGWVYWSGDDDGHTALYRLRTSGGAIEQVSSAEDRPRGRLLVDGDGVLMTNRENGLSNGGSTRPRLVRIGVDGTRSVIVGPGDAYINGVALSADRVYWTTLTDALAPAGTGTLESARQDGTEPSVLQLPGAYRLEVASDEELFYVGAEAPGSFSLFAHGNSASEGARLNQPVRIARGMPRLSVVAGDSIYFVTATDLLRDADPEAVPRKDLIGHRRRGEEAVVLVRDQAPVRDLRVTSCDVYWSTGRTDDHPEPSVLFRRALE